MSLLIVCFFRYCVKGCPWTFLKITLGMVHFQEANKFRPLQNARERTSFWVREPAISCGSSRVACAWILQHAKTSLRLEVNVFAPVSQVASSKLARENLHVYQDSTQHGARNSRISIFPALVLAVKRQIFNCCWSSKSSYQTTNYSRSELDRPKLWNVRQTIPASSSNDLKAMLHEAVFLATCNAMMTNKKTFQVAEGVSHVCNFFRNLQHVQ